MILSPNLSKCNFLYTMYRYNFREQNSSFYPYLCFLFSSLAKRDIVLKYLFWNICEKSEHLIKNLKTMSEVARNCHLRISVFFNTILWRQGILSDWSALLARILLESMCTTSTHLAKSFADRDEFKIWTLLVRNVIIPSDHMSYLSYCQKLIFVHV